MSLIYQDYEDRRRRERRAPVQKKIGRKKRDIDIEAKKGPGAAVGEKLLRVLSLFNLEERDRYAVKDALIGRPGFEHMSAEILAVMWQFIKGFDNYKPPRTSEAYSGKNLDHLLKTALPKVDFKKYTPAQKQALYAAVFRYVNWYQQSISTEQESEEEEDFEEGEAELSDIEELNEEVQEEENFEENDEYEGVEAEEEEGETETFEEEFPIPEGKQEEP